MSNYEKAVSVPNRGYLLRIIARDSSDAMFIVSVPNRGYLLRIVSDLLLRLFGEDLFPSPTGVTY